MPSISETIARLARSRGAVAGGTQRVPGRLTPLTGFGTNPGALDAQAYVPQAAARDPALVVVLHGCTQTADAYDVGSGWSQLAERHGFALLFPEQRRQNNPNLCFNWFSPGDNRRDAGEALSIRQMVAAMIDRHGIDPARVFVTGLSAGGAMTSVMLATYPEIFAGGAIIAGLPYGCANTVPQAFGRMRGEGAIDDDALAALIRNGSDHAGPWPTISVWHGSDDATVHPANADAVVRQWRGVHGLGEAPTRTETVAGYPHRIWCDAGGRAMIEEYSITGMGHGTPLATLGDDACGKRGAYMLEVRISSTQRLCRFWGLDTVAEDRPGSRAAVLPYDPPPLPRAAPAPADTMTNVGATGVGKVIEDALRAAGLMR